MNEKKHSKTVNILFILCLLLSATNLFSTGFYLYRTRSYRREYGEVTKELRIAEEELGRIRTVITDSKLLCELSTAECRSITDSTTKIRMQIKVLQDYYNNTNSLGYNYTNNNISDSEN